MMLFINIACCLWSYLDERGQFGERTHTVANEGGPDVP